MRHSLFSFSKFVARCCSNFQFFPFCVNRSVAGKASRSLTFVSRRSCLAVVKVFLLSANSLVISGNREMLHPFHTAPPFSLAAFRALSHAVERRNLGGCPSVVWEWCAQAMSMFRPSDGTFTTHAIRLSPSMPSFKPSSLTLFLRLLFSRSSTWFHRDSMR